MMSVSSLPSLPEPLRAEASQRELAAGQLLFQQGEIATALFVLASGRLRRDRHTRGDRTTSLGVVRPEALLNPANLTVATYRFDATAEVASRVLVYSLATLRHVWRREGSLGLWAAAGLSDCVCALEKLVELRSITPARDRVLHYLLGQQQNASDAAERVIAFDRSFKEIAKDLGLSAEAFYRTLASLERDGYLTRSRGRIDLHAKAG